MTTQRSEATIRFRATLRAIDKIAIVQLPRDASARLPSRGQVAVRGTVNGRDFDTVVEPDGSSGHWIRLDAKLQKAVALRLGETAALEIQAVREWPEPTLPEDFAAALAGAPKRIQAIWHDITPMARWEWVRWVNATRNPQTRKRRVEVSIAKMEAGKRRPCCFNLAGCTDPDLSQNGRLKLLS